MPDNYIEKYIIIMQVIDEMAKESLTINEIYMKAVTKAEKQNLSFSDKEIKFILSSLYDEFVIDIYHDENNVVRIKNTRAKSNTKLSK